MKIILTLLVLFFTFEANAEQFFQGQKHDSTKPINITANKLTLKPNKNKARFNGNVVATQGNMSLEAEKMLIEYHGENSKGKKKSTISKITADKGMVLNSEGKIAKAKKGVYDVDAEIVTLYENVELNRGSTVLMGDKFIYNVKTGKSRLMNEEIEEVKGKKIVVGSKKSKRVKVKFIPRKRPTEANTPSQKNKKPEENAPPKPIKKPDSLQ